MIRRIVSIGVLAIMILSGLVVMELIPMDDARGEQNPPVWNPLGYYETPVGVDWTIVGGDFAIYQDQTIVVNGNLIIEGNGVLNLWGVTLKMNCSFNGEFSIILQTGSLGQNGGILNIEESITDPILYPSIVTSNTEDGGHRFGFIVNGFAAGSSRSSHLTMTDTELRECGWDAGLGNDSKDSGLWIGSEGNTIENNTINNSFNGVNYIIAAAAGGYGNNNLFRNNNVSNCENGTYIRSAQQITIDNNEFYRCRQGINVNVTSSDLVVTNNKFMIINRSAANIGQTQGVTFNSNIIEYLVGFNNFIYPAVVFWQSSNINAHYNTLRNVSFHGMIVSTYTGGASFTYNDFSDLSEGGVDSGGLPVAGIGFAAFQGDSAYFYRNKVGENSTFSGSETVSFWADEITDNCSFIENEASNAYQYYYSNMGAAIHLWGVDEAYLKGNKLSANDNAGIYILDSGNYSVKIVDNIIDGAISPGFTASSGISMAEPAGGFVTYGGVKNTEIRGNYINNSQFGIYAEKGQAHRYLYNSVNDMGDTGILTFIDGTNISYNYVNRSGDGSAIYEGGIAIAGSQITGIDNPVVENVQIYKNTIRDCYATTGEQVAGIYMENAANIQIKENTLVGNQVGFYSYRNATNVVLENCTITDTGFTDKSIVLEDNTELGYENGSHVTTLNTTFSNSTGKLRIDPLSILTAKWYLHVNVKQGGTGVDGTTVQVQNLTGGLDPATGQPFTTTTQGGEPGWVKWIPVTEFQAIGTNITTYNTPHWVNVSAPGNLEGLAKPNVWMSYAITIDLNSVPVVDNLKLGDAAVYRTGKTYFFLNATDAPAEDSEDELLVFFEYRDSNNFAWNTTNLSSAQYDTASGGFWKVEFSPNASVPFGLYDVRARVKDTYDTYGSYSPWFYVNDTLDVKNNWPITRDVYNETNSPSAPPGSIYRGDYSWIYGDGFDIEDGEDDVLAVEFQYKRPGEAWGAHIVYWQGPTERASNNWRQQFQPALDVLTKTGFYGFQVRFQDLDGQWGDWKNLDNLTVLNNPPDMVGFSKAANFVYRGGTVRVYADVTDREQSANLQDLKVEFYYRHSISGTNWENAWFSVNNGWDGFSKYADFTPPYTAEIGNYEFWVNITDTDTPGVDGATVGEPGTGTIEVRNNIPIAQNIKVSASSVRAGVGELVYIHVNASDDEDNEPPLVIESIQWRENESISGDPPTPPDWMTSGLNKFSINTFIDYNSVGQYLRGSMEPKSDAKKVSHDIRARVRDPDTGISDWVYLMNAFTVTNPQPVILDIILQKTEVFRGDTVYITLNATDPGQLESSLTVYLDYRKVGDLTWDYHISVTPDFYDAGGFWKIPFTPDPSWDDTKLGTYEFRAKVENTAGVPSTYNETDDDLLVKNNIPDALTINTESGSVERGSTVVIYATGSDRELAQNNLDAIIEYSTDGVTWQKTYFTDDPAWSNSKSRWEVDFTPDSDADLGNYHFRVRFYDGKDYSDDEQKQNLVEVVNAVPSVTSLSVSTTSVFRKDTITLTAAVSDADQDESSLTPNFQFRVGTGSWVSQDTSNFFGDANYLGSGQWEIDFTPGASADTGTYSFRVEFIDDDGDKNDPAYESSTKLTVKNNEPEVEITSPSSGTQSSNSVKFEATGTDEEDTSLDYEWDFGDGKTSSEPNPTHKYSKAGDYIVTVTVTDDDGDTATDTVTITIKGETAGFDMMTLILILLPIILLVVVLVFLLTRKKKKPEEAIPPAAPGMAMAPGAPPAQPYAAPPAVPPGGPPGAAPYAAPPPPPVAPAAAPAAAAAGGQRIKCPKCGTGFTVTDPTRPITIECPNCHAKGKLT